MKMRAGGCRGLVKIYCKTRVLYDDMPVGDNTVSREEGGMRRRFKLASAFPRLLFSVRTLSFFPVVDGSRDDMSKSKAQT